MTKAQTKKINELMKVLRAVYKRCLDCSAYNVHEVKNCVMEECPLYPYRRGKIETLVKIPRKKPNSNQGTPLQKLNDQKNAS